MARITPTNERNTISIGFNDINSFRLSIRVNGKSIKTANNILQAAMVMGWESDMVIRTAAKETPNMPMISMNRQKLLERPGDSSIFPKYCPNCI